MQRPLASPPNDPDARSLTRASSAAEIRFLKEGGRVADEDESRTGWPKFGPAKPSARPPELLGKNREVLVSAVLVFSQTEGSAGAGSHEAMRVAKEGKRVAFLSFAVKGSVYGAVAKVRFEVRRLCDGVLVVVAANFERSHNDDVNHSSPIGVAEVAIGLRVLAKSSFNAACRVLASLRWFCIASGSDPWMSAMCCLRLSLRE